MPTVTWWRSAPATWPTCTSTPARHHQARPDISFTATAPSPEAYRLYLDFRHNGTACAAAFTVVAGEATDEEVQ
ncbi:hypothetical protein [Streptomyces heilongjiangensis]|uniref:Uncharacterized protein n=1 Tax=Streptomyces heilongjiangensis TaxID=945052 RepID=A0ABW1BFS9_9ACTN